jgi:hypothetical protein
MKKNLGSPLKENFVIFGSHKNKNYKTYDAPTPCIASAHWGDGLQAFWPSFHAWFAYSISQKNEKMRKKGPKFLTFRPSRKLERRYRGRLGGGIYVH